ncbi:MAG TPA: glutamyl-tRNA reductase [Oceanobacillus sp.]|nr:glutamyl-tRNA reductase [Oceanobacillus sp.]
MTLVLVGLNYRTTPLELRERLYLSEADRLHALKALHGAVLDEVVVVSTCNRLEIYGVASDAERAVAGITACLAERAAIPTAQLHIQTLLDRDAAHHVMRVAAGLESLALGETEILGQIADALKGAQQAETTGAVLSRLFHDAIHAGKRARTETSISQHTLSISHAAVLLAKQEISDLSSANVLVVGAGRMAELMLRALKAHNVSAIRVINRTLSRAQVLADRVGVEALEWQQLKTALRDADVVFTATSAPQPIISAADVDHSSLVLLDISVPRNVNPDVRRLQNVRLYHLDDLQAVVETHRSKRQSEVAQVEAIIAEELERYLQWLNSRNAVSTIVALRKKAEQLAEEELIRAFNRLPDLSDHEREVVAQMTHRIVNKLLHAPTTALRERAANGDHFKYLHAARQLFDLEIDGT